MPRFSLCLAALLIALTPSVATAQSFCIVVNAENPTGPLEPAEVAKIFLKKSDGWPHGGTPMPVDQVASSPVREAFSQRLFAKSTAAIKSFWQRNIFSGRNQPPPELASEEEVLAFIRDNSDAVGYVSASRELGPFVRYLEVEGLKPCHLLQETVEDVRGGLEIVSQQSDVYVLGSGSCGATREGRSMRLENRSPFKVRVVVDTSYWVQGSLRASRHESHRLGPGDEEPLGCSHPEERTEERFSIVEVELLGLGSGVALAPLSARDAVSFAEIGTCGRGAQGKRIAVVNNHPTVSIRVVIEAHQKIEGANSRQFQKSYVLSPGGSKALGCNADGPSTQTFRLVRAEYR